MEKTNCHLMVLGSISDSGQSFMRELERTGIAEVTYVSTIEDFVSLKRNADPKIVVLEKFPESRGWIQRLRELSEHIYLLWFGQDFDKSDLEFAIEQRVYGVFDSLSPDSEKVKECLSKVANLVEDDKRFEVLIHSIKGVLLQMQGDVADSVLQEMKSALGKVSEFGILNEFATGNRLDAKKGDPKLLFHDAEQVSDALATVDALERTGVLWIQSDLNNTQGQVDFIQGKIVGARAGEVNGLKALYRFFLWDEPTFVFTRREPQEFVVSEDLNLSVSSVCVEGNSHRSRYEKIKEEIPPDDIFLEMDLQHLNTGTSFSIDDFHAVAGVVEFKKVRNVVDYTPLMDVSLYESLIRLRKRQLLKVVSPAKSSSI